MQLFVVMLATLTMLNEKQSTILIYRKLNITSLYSH